MESKPDAEFEHAKVGHDYEGGGCAELEMSGFDSPTNSMGPTDMTQHGFSTKCVSDHTKPVPHTAAPSTFGPPTKLDASAHSQTPSLGSVGGLCGT